MNFYEISTCLSNRSQPNFDKEPIKDATIDDLNRTKLESYLDLLKNTRKDAPYTSLPFEQQLKTLNILSDDNGTLRPSLAGLLVFGQSPQRFEPQLVITFLQYYSTTETKLAPGGERFLDNRKFEGPIDEMTDEAYKHVLSRTGKGSLIQGVYRQDIHEYPRIAIREAIINATAHRDYSIPARGSHIQIKLFSDRLEVISPGGLYGTVALEDIVNGESTRNRFLMHFLEDLNVVENRGSGVDAILDATQSANLLPPQFEDRISSFKITLYNAQLQSDEEKILAYVREHGSIRRIECQTLLVTDSRRSKHILQKMRDSGLLKQKGTTKGAYYVIP
jgi:ATP-dependent DNA helicase RecG